MSRGGEAELRRSVGGVYYVHFHLRMSLSACHSTVSWKGLRLLHGLIRYQ